MLDDLKMIHVRDTQDALGVAEKLAGQLRQEFSIELNPQPDAIKNIVVSGMGGSALAALFASSWPGFTKPFEISRGYSIPNYVDSDTLFVACSYSGNTEETLAAIAEASQKQAGIIVIASGGKLIEIAQTNNYPYVQIPDHLQPRHAVFYALKALVTITDALGLTQNAAKDLASQADWLDAQIAAWTPTATTDRNLAKYLALEMIGKSVVIYSGPTLWPAAYKWKISLNENAKQIAWASQLPEYDHNEFMGWTQQPTDKPYAVIELRSHLDHIQIKKRFMLSERLLSGKRPSPEVVTVQGDTWLQQLLWTFALAEFTSIYTALLSNVDPTPVDLVEKLKQELAQHNAD